MVVDCNLRLGNELLNFEQTCTLLNLRKSKLRSMVFKSEIPVIRIGRLLRFDQNDLASWLEERKKSTNK